VFADRLNSMPKYVASRSLPEPLEWNATLLEGDLAHALTALGLVDEFWFWVSPSLWPAGPKAC
jgi:hypothetical protein